MRSKTMPCLAAKAFFSCLGLAVGVFLSASSVGAAEVYQLNWKESGIREVGGGITLGCLPQPIQLEARKPAGLKQVPAGLVNPLYGVITMGPPEAAMRLNVVADMANGLPVRFWLDSNGNGDFTDDPPCLSTNYPVTDPEGKPATAWKAEGTVTLPFGTGTRNGKLIFYTDTRYPWTRPSISYYADYGLVGEVKIDGQSLSAVLQDIGSLGCFRVDHDVIRNPILHLTDPVNKRLAAAAPVHLPFQIGGKWWAVTNLTLDGTFQIVAATPPPPRKGEVDLSPGKKAPAFTGKLLDGKRVEFPDDYKGKVVLLEFWATWYTPYKDELPNILNAYEKYHPQGLEILGIDLDQYGLEEKLAAFMKKENMTWPQVYDGKFMNTEVNRLYGTLIPPHRVLVDGDTGVILANMAAIRGEKLDAAIEEALAAKKK
jgi:peroxiredoxin